MVACPHWNTHTGLQTVKDYTKATRRARAHEMGATTTIETVERESVAARVSAILKVERQPDGTFSISFPSFDPKARETWALMREVKAIEGRRFDGVSKVWRIPAASAEEVEVLSATYGIEVESSADPRDAEIARLRSEIAQRDEYIAGLEAQLGMPAAA